MKEVTISPVARNLLCALRKAKKTSKLHGVPEDYFYPGDELKAFRWLKRFVVKFNMFPTPRTMRMQTGVRGKRTIEKVDFYIEEARNRIFFNRLMDVHKSVQAAAHSRDADAYVEAAKHAVSIGSSHLFAEDTGVVTLREALDEVIIDYDEAHATFGLRGITSGWAAVDHMMDGHQRGDLNTLVARPGRGKTNLLLYGAYQAWRAGASVLFVSMEMTSLQLGRRLLGIESKVNPRLIRTGRLDTRTRRDLDDYVSDMREGMPFNIVVGNFQKSVSAIKSLADEMQPDIIYADASYLLRPQRSRKGSETRRENVSDVVEELKQIAVQRDIPIAQTVQFNRQAVKPKRADRDEDETNPIAHLTMEKVGETDVVSQVSSVMWGLEMGDPPYQQTRRWMGFIKGREGEAGVWQVNYNFQPVDFSIIDPPQPDEDGGEDTSYIPGVNGPVDLNTVVD